MAKPPLTAPQRGRTAQDYTVIVAYDGERTEDEYFRGWKLVIPPSRLSLIPMFVRSGGNPLKAVTEAIKKKKKLSGYAEFWCVSDCDDTSEELISKAWELAANSDIKLCISRRCFEVWIFLHYEKLNKPITSEKEAIELVRQKIPRYGDRVKIAPFAELLPRTAQAIANAVWLRNEDTQNPSTNVDGLVKKLRDNML